MTLSDQAAERPTFTAETLAPGASAVTYVFLLTVTDNKNSTAANDEVIIQGYRAAIPGSCRASGPGSGQRCLRNEGNADRHRQHADRQRQGRDLSLGADGRNPGRHRDAGRR